MYSSSAGLARPQGAQLAAEEYQMGHVSFNQDVPLIMSAGKTLHQPFTQACRVTRLAVCRYPPDPEHSSTAKGSRRLQECHVDECQRPKQAPLPFSPT